MRLLSLVAFLSVFILSACGGGSESESPNSQPWLGGGSGGSGSSGGDGSGGSGGTSGNQPPLVVGVPTGNSEVPFGVEGTFLITASDPEGDVLTISLINAPDWMALDNTGRVTFTPNSANTFDSIYVQVSDGTNTVNSDTFSFTVTPPSEITFKISPDGSVSENDLFTFSVNQAGETLSAFRSSFVEDEGLFVTLPYPMPEALSSASLLISWEKASFVTYNKLVPSFSSLYEGLANDFTLSSEQIAELIPTPKTSAYYHTIKKLEDESLSLDLTDAETAFRLHNSVSASGIEQLAVYYYLARNSSDLQSIGDILKADISIKSKLRRISTPLVFAINETRLGLASLINNRLWFDLQEDARQSLGDYDFSWVGQVKISPLVNLNYSADKGALLEIKSDNSFVLKDVYTEDAEGNQIGTLFGLSSRFSIPDTSTWEIEGGALKMSVVDETPADLTRYIDHTEDVAELSTALIYTLGLPSEISFEWAKALVDVTGVERFAFDVVPESFILNSVYVADNADAFVASYVAGTVSLISDIDLDLSHRYEVRNGSHLVRRVPTTLDESKVMPFRSEIFDVVVVLPSLDEEGDVVYENEWLNLYNAPLVSILNKETGDFYVSDWSFDYAQDGKLVFQNPGFESGTAEYVVQVVAAASKDGSREGALDVHRYTVKSTLTVGEGEPVETLSSLNFSARALCEAVGRCSGNNLENDLAVWYNTENGLLTGDEVVVSSDIFTFITEQTEDDVNGEEVVVVEEGFQELTETSTCQGDFTRCWGPVGGRFSVTSGNFGFCDSRKPESLSKLIDIRNESFSLLEGAGKVSHYEITDIELGDLLYWTCSMLTAEYDIDPQDPDGPGIIVERPECFKQPKE